MAKAESRTKRVHLCCSQAARASRTVRHRPRGRPLTPPSGKAHRTLQKTASTSQNQTRQRGPEAAPRQPPRPARVLRCDIAQATSAGQTAPDAGVHAASRLLLSLALAWPAPTSATSSPLLPAASPARSLQGPCSPHSASQGSRSVCTGPARGLPSSQLQPCSREAEPWKPGLSPAPRTGPCSPCRVSETPGGEQLSTGRHLGGTPPPPGRPAR